MVLVMETIIGLKIELLMVINLVIIAPNPAIATLE